LRDLATREEPPTERERLLCVEGVGYRTLTLLEDGGYKTLGGVVKEDADRLGIRSGLGLKKAATVKQSAIEFANNEQALYAEARRAAEAEKLGNEATLEMNADDVAAIVAQSNGAEESATEGSEEAPAS
jgi:N utilization substance protein A